MLLKCLLSASCVHVIHFSMTDLPAELHPHFKEEKTETRKGSAPDGMAGKERRDLRSRSVLLSCSFPSVSPSPFTTKGQGAGTREGNPGLHARQHECLLKGVLPASTRIRSCPLGDAC